MSDRSPDISVLIPTYNRQDVVVECLRHLDKQALTPEQMEIIVIDDGSKDDTAATVRAFAKQMRFSVICESQPNSGASVARNRAIALSSGRIVLIINDDTLAVPGMVGAHLRLHEECPEEGVAGLGWLKIAPDVPDSIFVHLHHDTTLDDLPDRSELGWKYFATFGISAKAAFLRRFDLFDTNLRWYEDTELGLRLSYHGLRVLLVKDALGYHYHPMDEAKFLRIADADGTALGAWYRRNPELLPLLVPLGLQSTRLGTCELRHKLSDAVITRTTWPLWVGLARTMVPISRTRATSLYRKLFQWRKRRAIEAALSKA
jgi:glycosyltransferase involved in cell wall biosynthesis